MIGADCDDANVTDTSLLHWVSSGREVTRMVYDLYWIRIYDINNAEVMNQYTLGSYHQVFYSPNNIKLAIGGFGEIYFKCSYYNYYYQIFLNKGSIARI